MDEIPNEIHDSTRFLTMLFSPYAAARAARLELRCFAPGARTGRKEAGRWYPLTPEGIAHAAADAQRWGERLEVYFAVLPRRQGIGDATGLRLGAWLWADIDGGDDGPEGARELLTRAVDERGLPRPHVIVLSGGGLHCYWRLAEPVPVRERADQDRVRRALRRLVRMIGGSAQSEPDRDGFPAGPGAHADRASAEPARILRVPQTFNRKREPARPVRLIRCEEPTETEPARPLVWWCAHLPPELLPPRLPQPQGRDGWRSRYRDRGDRGDRGFGQTGTLPPKIIAKLSTPAPEGAKHYTMRDVAVWARKEGQDEAAIRSMVEQAGRASGVDMGDHHQQRHLDGIVDWAMDRVQPDYSRL